MSSTNKRKTKATAGGIMMRVAGVLLAITALTVWGTSFLLAKYTAGGNGGDKARVAKFEVGSAMTGDTVVVSVSEGGSGTFTVTLTNKSETAVRADLTLDFTELNNAYTVPGEGEATPAPVKIINTVKVKVGTGSESEYTVGADNKVTIPDKFDMAAAGTSPATSTVSFTLTIPALTGATGDDAAAAKAALLAITKNMTGLSGETEELPFDVIATFTQID